MPLLEVENLAITFSQYQSPFGKKRVRAISRLSVTLDEGEVLAVVGSSGSGKSLLAHAILGILPKNAEQEGLIKYRGEPLTAERAERLRGRELALVPQGVSYLDPLMRVGKQVRQSVNGEDPVKAQRSIFARYHLDRRVEKLYPDELSGGMARRVLLSTAMVSSARLIIADEPTPGLDEASLAEALANLREAANQGCAVMLITHDIGAAVRVADKVAVFYAGETVEIAPAGDFSGNGEALRHPYTKALWRALPQNGFEPIRGSQPSPEEMKEGCLFAPRCPLAALQCLEEKPVLRDIRGGLAGCFHA